jgi:hypothetical protein
MPALRVADEYTRREHEYATQPDLNGGGERRRVHVPVPDPCDGPEFGDDDDDRDDHGHPELGNEKRQGVPDAAKCRHEAADDTTNHWVPPPRERPIIR